MSDLVGNPEDRFSHNEAHFVTAFHLYCQVKSLVFQTENWTRRHEVQRRMISVVNFFIFLRLLLFALLLLQSNLS